MATLADFESLLKQTMGLDSASIGSAVIDRAVKERQALCAIASQDAYWDRVQSSEAELQELIEAVVVPETWFFRHRESFAALTQVALREWLATRPMDLFRVLSLPCSSGEEPYSIAMALHDAGLPPERMRIDALDISLHALADAKAGIYGRNSFRGGELAFRDRHFEAVPKGWKLADAVRAPVQFRHANLFSSGLTDSYDVIFCRNILIYFDRATQDRAIKVLTALLADKGILFVGPSEAALMPVHGFVSIKASMSFAFRKAGAVARKAPLPARPPRPPALARAEGRAAASRPARARGAESATASPVSLNAAPTLEAARQLADEGHLPEAVACCERFLLIRGPDANAYHLLGLLRDAAGEPASAAAYYRKALYLDPHHAEALAHLALLLESSGDKAGAEVLLSRARRHAHKARK